MYNYQRGDFFGIKVLCLFLLLFCAYKCHAQNPPQKINADYQFKGVGSDSVMRPPKRMSSYNLDSGAIAYNGPDSSYYTWTGHQWIRNFLVRSANGITDSSGVALLGGPLYKEAIVDVQAFNKKLWLKTIVNPSCGNYNVVGNVWIGDLDTAITPPPSAFSCSYPQEAALAISRQQEDNGENTVLLGMTTGNASEGVNGFTFRNFTNVAGHVQPQLYTFSPASNDGRQGFSHHAYLKNAKPTDTDIDGFLFKIVNYDDYINGVTSQGPVKGVVNFSVSNGSALVFYVDSLSCFKVGDGHSVRTTRSLAQMWLTPNDSTKLAFYQEGLGAQSLLESPLVVGQTFPVVDHNAILELSSTTKPFLPPRMTTTQRTSISPLPEGSMVYDTDLHHPFYFNGTIWVSL